MKPRHVLVPLLLAALASIAVAQCPATDPGDLAAIYPGTTANPNPPSTYPLTSDRYAVQYKIDGGNWTDARVYISILGGTTASPFEPFSNYPSYPNTSMSFVSIPARPNADVQLRVTKLWDAPFLASDHVSVRPSVKKIDADLTSDGAVKISRRTDDDFAGEQFILWWDRGTEGGGIEGLVFFLNPPYDKPRGSNVKKVTSPSDLGDLSEFDTLDFEGTVAIEGTGDKVLRIPANISNIFLAPGAWVQGKLRFEQSGAGGTRRIYGPGVLDVSRFDYKQRNCDGAQNYSALSFAHPPANTPGIRDQFLIDGIIVSDTNRYATDLLQNAIVNNMKTLGWNSNNDGLEFGTITRASNVFVRSGDDSLKMWGAYITVTNATVWQNYNGGVVNLGWFDNSPGENSLIDGVYVVKTDWSTPACPSLTTDTCPSFTADITHAIDHLNNAVIASMMVPGTEFGLLHPSLYRNIFVEDPPQALFSLKIAPPRLRNPALVSSVNLRQPSVLNLNIENVVTPPSTVANLIGFQDLPAGYDFFSQHFDSRFTMTGSMNIGLTDIDITSPDGRQTDLTSANAATVGKVATNGDGINLDYDSRFHREGGPQWYSAWTAPQAERIVPATSMPSFSMNDSSVRMIVRPTISGSAVRVKIENTVGEFPVTFSAAYIGKAQSGAALEPGSNTRLTFNGRPGLTLAPGAGAYSDPVTLPVEAFIRYAVSLDVTMASDISGHLLGLVTNYMATGAHAADSSGGAFAQVPAEETHTAKGPAFPVYWVAALDVASTNYSGTVVALGDSITDGRCSTRTNNGDANGMVRPDLYNRWTDLLAARFAGWPADKSLAVANEGIAGNEIAGGVQPALERIANDVLGREGATYVIFLEGTNDIAAHKTAADLIAADQRIIGDAHAIGLNIIGATILPRGEEPAWSREMEEERLTLNDWIRHEGNFDGVIDFDALMQGPFITRNRAVSLPSNWSCFDHVHPNAAGYAAMAAFIDLNLFRRGGRRDRSALFRGNSRSSFSASYASNHRP